MLMSIVLDIHKYLEHISENFNRSNEEEYCKKIAIKK